MNQAGTFLCGALIGLAAAAAHADSVIIRTPTGEKTHRGKITRDDKNGVQIGGVTFSRGQVILPRWVSLPVASRRWAPVL